MLVSRKWITIIQRGWLLFENTVLRLHAPEMRKHCSLPGLWANFLITYQLLPCTYINCYVRWYSGTTWPLQCIRLSYSIIYTVYRNTGTNNVQQTNDQTNKCASYSICVLLKLLTDLCCIGAEYCCFTRTTIIYGRV